MCSRIVNNFPVHHTTSTRHTDATVQATGRVQTHAFLCMITYIMFPYSTESQLVHQCLSLPFHLRNRTGTSGQRKQSWAARGDHGSFVHFLDRQMGLLYITALITGCRIV